MRDNNEALKFVNIKLFNIAEEAAICRIASLKWHQFCYRNTDYLSTFVINDGMQELVSLFQCFCYCLNLILSHLQPSNMLNLWVS